MAGAILLAAAALRFSHFGLRVVHGDEAVHAIKFIELWRGAGYFYDPHEYHGPTLNYLTLPVVWLCGVATPAELRIEHLRAVPALAGVLSVGAIWLLRDGMGRAGTLAAATFTAVSPVAVFYSRYYIQEALLALFSIVALGVAWRLLRSGRLGWAAVGGASLGLMHATKETALISFAAMSVAATVVMAARMRSGPELGRAALVALLLMAAATSAAFFSSFGANPGGIVHSFTTIRDYATRGTSPGLHDHPWFEYLSLIAWRRHPHGPAVTEVTVLGLAGVAAMAAVLRFQDRSPRVLLTSSIAAYTVVLWVSYSLLPYKTPWCVLTPLQAAHLLAGAGFAVLVDLARTSRWLPTLASVAVAAVCTWHAWQAIATSHVQRWANDARNPLVYAHPTPDVLNLARAIEQLARAPAGGEPPIVAVVTADPWPLPWYLRSIQHVGYWERADQVPAELQPSIWVLDAAAAEFLQARLPDQVQSAYYGLRPSEILILVAPPETWNATRDADSTP